MGAGTCLPCSWGFGVGLLLSGKQGLVNRLAYRLTAAADGQIARDGGPLSGSPVVPATCQAVRQSVCAGVGWRGAESPAGRPSLFLFNFNCKGYLPRPFAGAGKRSRPLCEWRTGHRELRPDRRHCHVPSPPDRPPFPGCDRRPDHGSRWPIAGQATDPEGRRRSLAALQAPEARTRAFL